MGRIQKLSDELANQIAAGEVVERPASVVKELVENALDAHATRVSVDVENGGSVLVRVTDDGEGMTSEDAILAVERHATSKLAALDDLFRLHTFGFRGEALPSIASVSRLILRTRARGAAEAVEIEVQGGRAPMVRPAGGATGTTIEVRDLFFNVPARRKFLKATATESAHIGDVVLGAALARHDITFTLSRDGRTVREYLRAASRSDRARTASAGETLAHVIAERGPLRIEAMLAAPERARSGATGLALLVNGRPVRDRVLARAVAHAYGSVLDGGRYPVGVVWIDLPSELVDVNVHPQKAEVRFTDARGVFDAVTRELHAVLARAFGLPKAELGNRFAEQARLAATTLKAMTEAAEVARARTHVNEDPAIRELERSTTGLPPTASPPTTLPRVNAALLSETNLFVSEPRVQSTRDELSIVAQPPVQSTRDELPIVAQPPVQSTRDELSIVAQPPVQSTRDELPIVAQPSPALFERKGAYGTLRFVGQVHGTFLLCEGEDGLYILDQHAAAERVTFDRLRRSHASRTMPTQRLLVPAVVELPPAEVALLEEQASDVGALGVELRAVGDGAVAVHAVPALLVRADPARVVRDLASELSRTGGRAFGGAIDLVLATMACHGSIRAGDAVTSEEARALLSRLDEVDFAGHCPHGRPVVMKLAWSELERRVGR